MLYIIFVFSMVCIVVYILKQLFDNCTNIVKYYINYTIFFLCTSLTAALVIPYSLIKGKDASNQKVFTYLVALIQNLVSVKYHIRNKEYLSEDGGAVLIGNHQSVLDTIGLSHLWNNVKYKVTVTVKKELLYAIPFGPSAYLAGVIFLDRNKSDGGYKQLQVTRNLLVNEKMKLWVFPEGTRNNDCTKLLPFKKGAFNLAVEAQLPIIPIIFSPYYFINHEKRTFDKGQIIMQCLEPVPTTGLTKEDVPVLVEQVYNKMNTAYKSLSKEVTSRPSTAEYAVR